MHYRKMGNTGIEVSALGFGAMRLPVIGDDSSKIDEEKAIAMIRYSIDNGVNYLDTAYPYHDGQSEILCGKALKDGYREKVSLATKMPSWEVHKEGDMERILDEQLKKLDVDCIDFYLLHTLTGAYWDNYKKLDYKAFLTKAKAEGKIKYLGFSFHDHCDLFKDVVDDFEWDFCQIQLNYLDENYQAGVEGMRYASKKGMGVIVMEPLRGGMLAKEDLPDELKTLWDSAVVKRTPAEWALRYVFDFKEVSCVLSGMTTMEQVEQNMATADKALPKSLSEKEKELISKAKDFYLSRIRVNCTNCRYCMPCPSGVYIPEIFWGYNHDSIFGDFDKAKFWTTGFLKEENQAHNCIECGKCEEHCPQNIEIIKHLKKVVELYGA